MFGEQPGKLHKVWGRGVAGAEDEHAFFIGHDLSFPLVKDAAPLHPPPRQVTPASAIETEALRRERRRIGPR